MEMGGTSQTAKGPVFRDIRRYYCEYCGISRSKKSLLASHILSDHKDKMNEKILDGKEEKKGMKSRTCEDCGATFSKPAHLKQHMLSHSLERPFTCPLDDCHSSYRRKDHLNRHLLKHQGKLFKCPIENCGHEFAYHCNMKRHFNEFHGEGCSSTESCNQKHVCPEPGCEKVFRYPSQLQKHEASHIKLNTVEVFCSELGCMKPFANEQCLMAHIQSCHRYISCEICGGKQLKRNMKRHLRNHETGGSSQERIRCSFKGCLHTFSTRSNLQQHVKAVHLAIRPFTCRMPGCEMRFAFKHVRNNHEQTGCHIYTHGDFEDSDEQFRSRPRGGQKRKYPSIESLMRKRVVPPKLPDLNSDEGSAEEHQQW